MKVGERLREVSFYQAFDFCVGLKILNKKLKMNILDTLRVSFSYTQIHALFSLSFFFLAFSLSLPFFLLAKVMDSCKNVKQYQEL